MKRQVVDAPWSSVSTGPGHHPFWGRRIFPVVLSSAGFIHFISLAWDHSRGLFSKPRRQISPAPHLFHFLTQESVKACVWGGVSFPSLEVTLRWTGHCRMLRSKTFPFSYNFWGFCLFCLVWDNLCCFFRNRWLREHLVVSRGSHTRMCQRLVFVKSRSPVLSHSKFRIASFCNLRLHAMGYRMSDSCL